MFLTVIGLTRYESKEASLEPRVQAAEETLASQVSAGTNPAEYTNTDPCESLQNIRNTNQANEPDRVQSKVSKPWLDTEHMIR